jgi:hypothetical protein
VPYAGCRRRAERRADVHRCGLDRVEVHGHDKQGAAYGSTWVLGYEPLFATLADTGPVGQDA